MSNNLNLPKYNFRLKDEDKKTKIFDSIRRKYVVLTPEEWVRQNLIQFLVTEKKYPAGLIAVETALQHNGRKRRSDIVFYNTDRKAVLLVECKASDVKISQDTFDQISRYNIFYKVPYLLVSNGLDHYVCKIDFENNSYQFLKEVPDYLELSEKNFV